MSVQTAVKANIEPLANQAHSPSILYSEHEIRQLRETALRQILDLIVWQEGGVAFARAGSGSFNGSPINQQYRLAWWRDTTRMILGLQALPENFPSQPSIGDVVNALAIASTAA